MVSCFSFLCWPLYKIKPSKTKTKNMQMTSIDSGDGLFKKLPEDVIIHILIRLPATDLFRLMLVSKLFKPLISRSCFLNLHLSSIISRPHDPTTQLLLQIDRRQRNRFFFCYENGDSFGPYKSVEIPCWYEPFSTGFVEVVSSIGGVICFYHRVDLTSFGTLFLWNPLIRVLKCLPPVPQSWAPLRVAFGFGFDQASGEFKVVKINYRDLYKANFLAQAFVYTSKTKSWRTIENVPCIADLRDYGCCKGVSVDGYLYWPAYTQALDYYTHRRPDCIMGFDLVEEVFKVLTLPQDMLMRDQAEFRLSTWFEGYGCTRNVFVVNVRESSKLALPWEKKGSVVMSCSLSQKFVNARELAAEGISTQSYTLSNSLMNAEEDEMKDHGDRRFLLPFAYVIDYTPSLGLLDSYCPLERQVELGRILFRNW